MRELLQASLSGVSLAALPPVQRRQTSLHSDGAPDARSHNSIRRASLFLFRLSLDRLSNLFKSEDWYLVSNNAATLSGSLDRDYD